MSWVSLRFEQALEVLGQEQQRAMCKKEAATADAKISDSCVSHVLVAPLSRDCANQVSFDFEGSVLKSARNNVDKITQSATLQLQTSCD